MNASFYNGISGVKTQQFGLDVWGNNISNISTNGFIAKTPEFSTLFSTALTDNYFGTSSNDMGLGSKANAASLNTFTQGIFQPTDRVFDLALDGEGYFGVQSIKGQTLYSRNGAFNIDANGDMVDDGGNYLLGTLGENISETTFSQEKLKEFGTYYKTDSKELGTPYQIEAINDITLGDVNNQSKIHLPDILYYPAVPTTSASFKANLNPQINIDSTNIDVNENDINQTIDTANQTASVDGTITNTPEVLNAQENDTVEVTFTDINGNTVNSNAMLDANLNWSVVNKDISSLDTENEITTTAKINTTQEIPNVEHFSSTIISPESENDILDMTYTKRIPQTEDGSVWDGKIKIYSFYETYNPDSTYDPALYKVNKTTQKVYSIVDSQTAVIKFDSVGKLISKEIPTMDNSGTPLSISIGEINTYDGFTSNSDITTTRFEEHDGEIQGFLNQYSMDKSGNVVAEFDNGKTIPIAKVAVYHFRNDQGLSNVTSTLFGSTSNSGNALFYTDANGTPFLGARIRPNNLETSNVLFSTALTELLLTQKAFDANAKSITTSDQLIQNAINMKK